MFNQCKPDSVYTHYEIRRKNFKKDLLIPGINNNRPLNFLFAPDSLADFNSQEGNRISLPKLE